jgi:serine/threonine protein kinase
MAEDATQPATQLAYDPRRLGRNPSNLREDDVSDILCILSPYTPAAFHIVSSTASEKPYHILQNTGSSDIDTDFDIEDITLPDSNNARDIALRFSSSLMRPDIGFLFGRNARACDVVLVDDPNGANTKRISNTHFRIYMAESGAPMLEDMSTNGTTVDNVELVGKGRDSASCRILQNGSVIDILSPFPEHRIIFHVQIPSRNGYEAEFQRKAAAFQRRANAFRERHKNDGDKPIKQVLRSNIIIPSRSYGMKWDGSPKYCVTGCLGKGAFATVYQITTINEGKYYAVKELEKRRYVKDGVLDRKLSNEMEIMKTIKHPHIVEYVEYHDVQDYLYIVMEFIPFGDLQHHLKRGPLREDIAILVARQTLQALDYLHSNNITHRDIKPDNILIASEDPFTIKLSDFGLSKVKKDDTFLKTFCGTLLYCAPEVFPHYQKAKTGSKRRHSSKSHSYTHAVDIWSLAGVLWYALCLSPPFEGVVDPTGQGMFQKIMYTPLDPKDLDKKGISEDAKDLLLKMLSTEPEMRPTARQCLRHRWLNDGHVPPDPQDTLSAIHEEDDEAQKFSQLSLRDEPLIGGGASFSGFESIVEEEDFDFIDEIDFGVSRSKRVKTDVRYPRNQPRTTSEPESSEELSSSEDPSYPQSSGEPADSDGNQRLFGEISHSALEDSNVLGHRTEVALGRERTRRTSADNPIIIATSIPGDSSASLFGTESMVRDLNMRSPDGSESFASPESSMNSLHDPDLSHRQMMSLSSEDTPRAATQTKIDSQLDRTPTRQRVPLPDTRNVSAASVATLNSTSTMPQAVPTQVALQWSLNRPKYGTLISTMDSAQSYFLGIDTRVTQYGRQSSCTLVYPHRDDRRVSRFSFVLVFNAADIEAVVAAGGDWTKLPDLHVLIKNFSKTAKLWVNDSAMPAMSGEGIDFCGRLYTGDVITIFQPHDGGEGECLRFVCDFFIGEGRLKRSRSFVKEATLIRKQGQNGGDMVDVRSDVS